MHKTSKKQLRNEAISLLGNDIVRYADDTQLVGKIVEVELYYDDDPASHSYKGKTKRNESMFLPRNHAYVYFTYGMHYCLNVSAGPEGQGAAVLIRAIEPLNGVDIMMKNRRTHTKSCQHKDIANGPAKLTQALAVDKELDGHSLLLPPLQIKRRSSRNSEDIVCAERIGITKATNELLRFYLRDNPYISKA